MRFLTLSAVVLLVTAWAAAAPDPVALDEQIVRAVHGSTDGPALVEYFRKRAATGVDGDKLRTLVRQLGDDDFLTRERASAALVNAGSAAVALLDAAARDPDVEIAYRARECLRRIGKNPAGSVDMAAARLLVLRQPPGAAQALLAFIPLASTNCVADELQDCLTNLAGRDAQANKALVEALGDKGPVQRAAAAVALCRAGTVAARPAIRKLLQDPDSVVRLRVGIALANAGEKEAVPALIDLLGDLRTPLAWEAEDVLFQIADDQPPEALLGSDAAGRTKCRDAWAAWWAKNRDKADLGKLMAAGRPLGRTLLVLLDAGKVREVDAEGKTLWEIEGLDFPLDAQLLPNGNLLCPENHGNRVTERDPKGRLVWEYKVPNNGGPLSAQRLANGNTFLGVYIQQAAGFLVEVDRAGREVARFTSPDGEGFRKAAKLRNGDIACVTVGGRYLRWNSAGKELANFNVNVSTNGGRIDVTPAGHVLIPEMDSNRIVELDADGKPVWECAVERPIAAVRLPNGHTLVTTIEQQRALEFDRSGRVVWEYKSDTRVTRAFRR